jgi:hypothetical protein
MQMREHVRPPLEKFTTFHYTSFPHLTQTTAQTREKGSILYWRYSDLAGGSPM